METKLNNFILWCKGWYITTDNNKMDLFEQASEMLKLDGYILCSPKNVIGIVTNYIDGLIDKNIIHSRTHYFRLNIWNQNVSHNMMLYNLDYSNAVLLALKHFFMYHVDNDMIQLNPPTYSRKLFKIGFIAPTFFGNSYKMANNKVKKYFNKK